MKPIVFSFLTMHKALIAIICLVMLPNQLMALECLISNKNDVYNDSIKGQQLLESSFLPLVLVAGGLVLNQSDFEKNLQKDLREKLGNDFYFGIDNVLLFVPSIEVYAFDLIGLKSKNHWFDQTKYMAISNVTTLVLTLALKELINKQRPNKENNYSMPSGHSSLVFTNATIVYQEFYESSPALASTGYIFASATAAMRVANNKHWISDVMVGAGLGIVVTNLVYYFEPLKNFNPFKKDLKIVFLPQLGIKNYGLTFVSKF